MAATITDNTPGPIVVQSGSTVTPFTAVDVNDPLIVTNAPPYLAGGGGGNVNVQLTSPSISGAGANLGTLTDSTTRTWSPGSYNPDLMTFTEPTLGGPLVPGNLGPLDTLHNVQYAAPILVPGQSAIVDANVSYDPNGAAAIADPKPVVLDVLPAATNGVITTDLSSADLGAGLANGAKFTFINPTETILLTDGTLSVGPDTNEATIQRLYEGLLGRGSDTGGLSGFDAQLTSGISKATVASEFLNSPEYVSAHGTPSNNQFVTSLYQGILGRAPDPGGAALWTGALNGGASRTDVAIGFADAAEAKSHLAPTTAQLYVPNAAGTLVHELFETGLGREVDLASLPSFKAAYATQTPAQLAADIAGSPEFINDHIGQNNAAYVSSLYQDGLGRAPDAAGSALWTGQLNSGSATRSDVLLNVAVSNEGAAHLTHNLSA